MRSSAFFSPIAALIYTPFDDRSDFLAQNDALDITLLRNSEDDERDVVVHT